MVVAKNDEAHLGLQNQFAERTIEKVYHAIVCGELKNSRGEIRAAIARHPTHRKRMAVAQGEGRDAWTTYRVASRLKHSTLVEATILTGRTHQIRVHFEHIGHPVVGDATYGKRANQHLREQTGYTAPRQMLHARQLAFTHPRTGEEKIFEAPWPADFREALERLKE
jgi:23S rRNA pseudouridine1911/1915/1917 synthase